MKTSGSLPDARKFWRTLNIEDIVLLYSCSNHETDDCLWSEDSEVNPNFFEESGLPICAYCGNDLSLTRAIVRI